MTRDQLIQEFRTAASDWLDPYLVNSYEWDTVWLIRWLEEAQIEACVRGRLLHESENEDVCVVPVSAGTSTYPLHASLYEITHSAFRLVDATQRTPIKLTSTEELDRTVTDWRDLTGTPEFAVQGEESIRLVPRPNAIGELLLEGYRLPLNSLAISGAVTPEIHAAHHRQLINWLLFRAFSTPKPEIRNMDAALKAEIDFNKYFGMRPDSDLRRITREDVQHHNRAWF
jgi:hypothetical protein